MPLFLGAISVSSCTPQGQATVVRNVIDVVGCVVDHQDEPDPQVVAECVREHVTASDVLEILTRQRRATEKQRKGCAARSAIELSPSDPCAFVQAGVDGRASASCVTREEAQYMEQVIVARRDGGATATCEPLPFAAFCAEPREIILAIDTLIERRSGELRRHATEADR